MTTNAVEFYKRAGWYVTSPYGPRTGKYAGFHRGVDFGGFPCGAPVVTPFSGTVVAAKTSGMGTWGNTVCIELEPGRKYVSLNAHLEKITVKEGQRVEAGDQIGTNGGSNHSGGSYSCHIHYEIQKNTGTAPWRGEILDPASFWLAQKPMQPSSRFSVGDYIISGLESTNVNVREEPSGKIIDKVGPGEGVRVVGAADNGLWLDGYYWWKTTKGWVAEAFFGVLMAPDPEPETPPELIDEEDTLVEEVTKPPEGLMELLRSLYELLKQIFGG